MIDVIARFITHPMVQAGAATILKYYATAGARARAESYMKEAMSLLDKLPSTSIMVPGSSLSLPQLADPIAQELAKASAILDEAYRFAMRGSAAEVKPRVERAAEHLMKAERFYMTPGELMKLPSEKRELAKKVAPRIAAVRQVLVNQPEQLEQAAAEVSSILSGWSTGRVMGGGLKVEQHSLPEMNPATGCIPCARSHLAQVAAELEEAARNPFRAHEWATDAAKQLMALEEIDWSQEKIEASAPEVKELVERYKPEVEELKNMLLSGSYNISEVAARARDLQRRFSADADRVKTVLDRAFDLARAQAGGA